MENNKLNIEILSPEGRLFQGGADELIIPTVQGEIGVLPGHIPLIAKIAEGEIRLLSAGREAQSFTVVGGFLEVSNDKVSVLADHAIRSDQIESQKAEEARRRAETLLSGKLDLRESAHIEKDIRRAAVELKVYRKRRKKQ